ncbi:MAG: TonB-dependent receptor [Ignavibacteriales bacterium]|nr:TonB-dependent receptor [Ignavibacteriales bacterium]
MIKRLLSLIFIFTFLFLSYSYAGNTGKISGKVTESETGEPLLGINIILEGTTLGAASDIDGNYMINNISPGTYTITVSGIGFQKKSIQKVQVAADFTTKLDIQLSSEAISVETVMIIASTPMVRKDLTSSQVSIDANQITTLPVESVDQLLTLQAGIIKGAGGEIHIKGGRSSEVSYNVNGVSIINPFDNSKSVEIATNAIQELSVVSGTFNAEYGNALSGIVNSITKEGSKNYSGSFSFYTGDYLSTHKNIFYNIDAIDPINNYVAEFTLGGPIPLLENYVTFFFSGRLNNDKGYLYGIRQHEPSDYIQYLSSDSISILATGDGKTVSMNPSKDWSGNGKITFKPISTIKINYDFLISDSKYQTYNHDLKYNPDANYHRYNSGLFNSLEFRHVLNNSTFYSLKGSYNINDYKRYLYPLLDASGNEVDYSAGMDVTGLVADPRYGSSLQYVAQNTFPSGGTLNQHFYQKTKTVNGKLDLTSQINLNHEIKFGAEFKHHILDYESFQILKNGTASYIPAVDNILHDKYVKKPTEISGYLQDKMEFDNLILNVGLRLDYFDSDSRYSTSTQYPSPNDQTIPDNVDKFALLKKAAVKYQVSPRIGFSFPITDKGIIHFSYGHFFQIPPFTYLYTNPDFKYPVSGTPTFGNANLNPEKTITYEIGLQQQLMDNLSFDITGYVKDVRDLLALQKIQSSATKAYYMYVNKDYANIKGVTFSLRKRRNPDELFGAALDYTFQSTEGSDTRAAAAFLDLASGRQSEKLPYYLDWDQPHTLNATINFGGETWNATLVGRIGSGLPYTPQLLFEQIYLKTNSARKPSQATVDLLVDKTLNIFDLSFTFFFKVFNLFDTLNENVVYDNTGRANYTLEKELGTTQAADYYASLNPLIKPSSEYFVRPDFYLPTREVRMGLTLEF